LAGGFATMAMGRDSEVQPDLIVTWAEIPRSPGHAFYDKRPEAAGRGGLQCFRRGDVQALLCAADGSSVAAAGPLFSACC